MGGPRRRLSVDARRAELLEIGLAIFGERSLADVSVDEIADEAGVSVGLLYHHFGSKRGFFLAVVQHADDLMRDAIQPDPGQIDADAVHQSLERYFRYVAENRSSYLGIVRGAAPGDPEVAEIVERSRALSIEAILAVLEPTPGPLAVEALHGWLVLVEDLAIRWSADPRQPLPELITLTHKLLDAALAATGMLRPRVVDASSPSLAVLVDVLAEATG